MYFVIYILRCWKYIALLTTFSLLCSTITLYKNTYTNVYMNDSLAFTAHHYISIKNEYAHSQCIYGSVLLLFVTALTKLFNLVRTYCLKPTRYTSITIQCDMQCVFLYWLSCESSRLQRWGYVNKRFDDVLRVHCNFVGHL